MNHNPKKRLDEVISSMSDKNDKIPSSVEKETTVVVDNVPVDDAKRRGSSFLQVARSSFLRRVSGLSNDIESGSKEDDDGTVESIDMEDEDELMDVSAAVVIASVFRC